MMRVAILFLLLLLLAPKTAAADNAPHHDLPDGVLECPTDRPWEKPNEELGGSYIGNGWENGLLYVLQLTAISGQVHGFFIANEINDEGHVESATHSVRGIHDESQLSMEVDFFLDSLTLTGTWNEHGLSLSYQNDSGGVSSGYFASADDLSAQLIAERFADADAREGAANTAGYFMAGTYQAAQENAEVFYEQSVLAPSVAARMLGMPMADALSLLFVDWKASVNFGVRRYGNLPNQVDSYSLHISGSPQSTLLLASCVIDARRSSDAFERVDQESDLDFLFVSEFSDQVSDGGRIPGHIMVVAGQGQALATFHVYGSSQIRSEIVGQATALLSSYNLPQEIGA